MPLENDEKPLTLSQFNEHFNKNMFRFLVDYLEPQFQKIDKRFERLERLEREVASLRQDMQLGFDDLYKKFEDLRPYPLSLPENVKALLT